MSVKCEEPLDELTVQVWLLYLHPNFNYWTLFVSRTELWTDGQSDRWTDKWTIRLLDVPGGPFRSGGIKRISNEFSFHTMYYETRVFYIPSQEAGRYKTYNSFHNTSYGMKIHLRSNISPQKMYWWPQNLYDVNKVYHRWMIRQITHKYVNYWIAFILANLMSMYYIVLCTESVNEVLCL